MSVAIPYIAAEYHLDALTSGAAITAFFAGYAITQIPGGLLADKFGVRKVAASAMLWWSIFTALTGAAVNITQLFLARFIFGLGEGVFPACAFKTIAIWFPQRERATANAVMLASNPLGAALGPLAVVAVMSVWGWRAVFFSLFLPGVLVALLFWVLIPDKPSESRHVSPDELIEIDDLERSGSRNVQATSGILAALKEPNILKYFLAILCFDVAYWGFMTWLPTYLVKARGFSMVEMGVAAALPPLAGVAGSILGGWISDRYFKERRRVPIVIAQLISALLLYLTFSATSGSTLVIYQTLAGLFLNFFLASFWALPMNSVPKQLMGVVGGFINMAGQIAAFLSPLIIGYLVEVGRGSFALAFDFFIAAILASCLIVLSPRIRTRPGPNAVPL